MRLATISQVRAQSVKPTYIYISIDIYVGDPPPTLNPVFTFTIYVDPKVPACATRLNSNERRRQKRYRVSPHQRKDKLFAIHKTFARFSSVSEEPPVESESLSTPRLVPFHSLERSVLLSEKFPYEADYIVHILSIRD